MKETYYLLHNTNKEWGESLAIKPESDLQYYSRKTDQDVYEIDLANLKLKKVKLVFEITHNTT